MFQFLNQVFLPLALGAAAIPILIHLIRRNRAQKVHFAAMQFLLDSSRPMVRWLRLKQFLILLMRILAVVLLGLAFARPYFPDKQVPPIWKDVQKEVALVIDLTASLYARDHLARLKQEVRQILRTLPQGANVSVILAGAKPRIIVEKQPISAGLVTRIMSRLTPGYGSGRLNVALQMADDLLRGSGVLVREIYVLSDFQKTVWPADDSRLQLSSNANVLIRPLAEERWKNIGLIDARTGDKKNRLWACSVRNFSTFRITNIDVSLFVNERRIGRKRIRLEPGEIRVVNFRPSRLPAGVLSGYFELVSREDEYSPDNRYYFTLQQQDRIRVLGINGESARGAADELFFIRKALTVPGAPFSFEERPVNHLAGVDPRAFDVIILANVKGVGRRFGEALSDFIREGGGLIIAPGDQVEPALFNRLFGTLAPAAIQKKARNRLDRATGDLLLVHRPDHPIFQPLVEAGTVGLTSSVFFQHWILKPQEGSEVLASYLTNHPALISHTYGRGKVIMLAFPLDAEWSELPVKAAFLPLVYRMVEFLNPKRAREGSFETGQPLFLADRFDFSRPEPVQVRKPDGTVLRLPRDGVIFAETNLPGLYEFSQGHVRSIFAFNVPAEESHTELIEPDKFLSLIDKSNEPLSPDRDEASGGISARETESQQKLWRFLLAAVFVLLLGESFLANRTPR